MDLERFGQCIYSLICTPANFVAHKNTQDFVGLIILRLSDSPRTPLSNLTTLLTSIARPHNHQEAHQEAPR